MYQAAARVRKAFEGKVIEYCQFRVPRFATVDLSGRTVESVRSVGKHHLIDVGDDPVEVGDEVVVFGDPALGRQGADDWARASGSITWDVVASLSARLPRSTA